MFTVVGSLKFILENRIQNVGWNINVLKGLSTKSISLVFSFIEFRKCGDDTHNIEKNKYLFPLFL